MNRVDRLFAIILLLQRKKRVRAQDLAQSFEVSERTIYRDMAALSESGVPIVSLPGEGYELVEGYYLPPLLFTPAEARALFLSAQMLMAHATGGLNGDVEQALAKIAVVLPKGVRKQAEQLAATVQFVMPPVRFDFDDARLATLQRAIQERRVVRLRYHSYSRDQTTERDVEPRYLSYYNGAWYMNGYCRLRQDMRGFRFDRIEHLAVLPATFEPRSSNEVAAEPIVVQVCFAPEIVRWVRERQHYAFQTEQPAADGEAVVMSYRIQALSEIVPWLLSWGAAARVLSPTELRERIRQEALRLLDFLT